MIQKFFEIRDRMTLIPALAIRMNPDDCVTEGEKHLVRLAGYANYPVCILLIQLETQRCSYDAYNWGAARTMRVAHEYIISHFDYLSSGQVIDVEYILGEKLQIAKCCLDEEKGESCQ
jgi:hypothetical protein